MGIIFAVRNLLENNPLGFRSELWKSGRHNSHCLERLMVALWGIPDQTWKSLSPPLHLLSRKPGRVPSNIFSLPSFLFGVKFHLPDHFLGCSSNPITVSYLALFMFMGSIVWTGTFIHTPFFVWTLLFDCCLGISISSCSTRSFPLPSIGGYCNHMDITSLAKNGSMTSYQNNKIWSCNTEWGYIFYD